MRVSTQQVFVRALERRAEKFYERRTKQARKQGTNNTDNLNQGKHVNHTSHLTDTGSIPTIPTSPDATTTDSATSTVSCAVTTDAYNPACPLTVHDLDESISATNRVLDLVEGSDPKLWENSDRDGVRMIVAEVTRLMNDSKCSPVRKASYGQILNMISGLQTGSQTA